jgi:hypothetical protein
MAELTRKAKADRAEAEKKLQAERERQQREWEATHPLRVQLYYDNLLKTLEHLAKEGKNTHSVQEVGYPQEIIQKLKDDKFEVTATTRRVEIQECLNYDTGNWRGTGEYQDKVDLVIKWPG